LARGRRGFWRGDFGGGLLRDRRGPPIRFSDIRGAAIDGARARLQALVR